MDLISKISKLIVRKFLGELDDTEKQELDALLNDSSYENVYEKLANENNLKDRYLKLKEVDVNKAIQKFDFRTDGNKLNEINKYITAAAILIVIITGGLFLSRNKEKHSNLYSIEQSIVPGGYVASLKLDNGEVIKLSHENIEYELISQFGITVNPESGELLYSQQDTERVVYNELILPRGGEYKVTLSDGTLVHLNSASSLYYPLNFRENERIVNLTGEAYFDIAPGDKPFKINVGNITVVAYGTSFNINSYDPSNIITALVSGKVGVIVNELEEEYIMEPNQILEYNSKTNAVALKSEDAKSYSSWSEGWYYFENKSLEYILENLGIWYDFDIEYMNDEFKNIYFSGSLKRYDQINIIIDAISYLADVKVEQKGKKLIIKK